MTDKNPRTSSTSIYQNAEQGPADPIAKNDVKKGKSIKKQMDPFGYFSWRPSCLQCFNKVGCIVFFISIAHCLQNATNGILGVTLTTLERRFHFSSFQSSLTASFYEVGQVPAIIFIMFFGNKLHRPKWMGVGMLLVMVGCLIMVVPKSIAPPYQPHIFLSNSSDSHDLCLSGTTNITTDCPKRPPPLSGYLVFFVLGRSLIGIGATPILTVGLTFINDCTDIHGFALYSGIYNAMSIIGPGVGLVAASLFLKLFEGGPEEALRLQLKPSDKAWLGNWWVSYVFVSAFIAITVPPLFGYSDKKKKAGQQQQQQQQQGGEVQEGGSKKDGLLDNGLEQQPSKSDSQTSALRVIFRLLTNPIFILACIFNFAEMFIIMGFNAFGPKIFENFLSLSPTVAGLLFGAVLLPAGATGTILGGLVIKRFRMKSPSIVRMQMALSFVVLCCLPVLLLNCSDVRFAGVNAGNDPTALNVNNDCNSACSCEKAHYNPVCSSNNVQYFSACHAGCASVQHNDTTNTNTFSNCVCVLDEHLSTDTSPKVAINSSKVISGEAVSGVCERPFCFHAYIFLPLFAMVVLLVFMCFTTNITLIFRAVRTNETTAAVCIQMLSTKLLGSIPGPILFGVAFDQSCGLYDTNRCSSSSQCLFIHTAKASRNVLILCSLLKLLNTATMLFMHLVRKRQNRLSVSVFSN